MLDGISATMIVGALVGIVGLTLVYGHWRILWLEYQAYSWNVVEGEIVRSELGI